MRLMSIPQLARFLLRLRAVQIDGQQARPRSGSVSSLVAQFAERVISHMHLTGEWKAAVQKVLRQERATEGDERQSESIKRALENLRKQHLWGDLVDDEYRRERAALERQLRSIYPPLRSPQLPNLERAAQLLTDLPGLWLHPGVSHEQRENLIREVFNEITIDGTRFMTIKPRPVYVPLFATMLLESNVDYCGREPTRSPNNQHLFPSDIGVLGIDVWMQKLADVA